MAKFTSEDHNGPAQLDSALQQFRDAALKQDREWEVTIHDAGGKLILGGEVRPPKPPAAAPTK